MKIIIRIREGHLMEVAVAAAIALRAAPVNNRMHIFIGFFSKATAQVIVQDAEINIDVIIFLSLYKSFNFGC